MLKPVNVDGSRSQEGPKKKKNHTELYVFLEVFCWGVLSLELNGFWSPTQKYVAVFCGKLFDFLFENLGLDPGFCLEFA